jgi:hypothetical protein
VQSSPLEICRSVNLIQEIDNNMITLWDQTPRNQSILYPFLYPAVLPRGLVAAAALCFNHSISIAVPSMS